MGAFDELAPTVGLFDTKARTDLEWLAQRQSDSRDQQLKVEKPQTAEKLTVTGLFAGIGGLEQGFRQAGHACGMLCELDPIARGVLQRHFPGSEITTDIKALTTLPRSDVVTAGFPCQDL